MYKKIVPLLALCLSTGAFAHTAVESLKDVITLGDRDSYFKYSEQYVNFETYWEGMSGEGVDFFYATDNTNKPKSIMTIQAFGKDENRWNAIKFQVAFEDARDKQAEISFKNAIYRLLLPITKNKTQLTELIYSAQFFEQIKQQKFHPELIFFDENVSIGTKYERKKNGSWGFVVEITRMS